MNEQTNIEDSTAHDQVAVALERVRSDVNAFDKIEAGIAKLQTDHPADLAVDLSTPAGMKLAIAARAAWREPRVNLERARKAAKAPVLELGRSIDRFAADLEARLRIGEDNYDSQIKAEEERKARIKKEAEEKEAARVKQIQGRIAFHFSTVPMLMTGKPAADIRDALAKLDAAEVTEDEYAEFVQDAINAKQAAHNQLHIMGESAAQREQEAEEARTVAERNRQEQERLRREQEAFEAEKRAERERIQREANEREEQRKRQEAERRAELQEIEEARAKLARERQAEEDRKAAAERKRLDDEAAEARRIADEQHRAEMQRKRDEAAAEQAERERVAAEQEKARKAAEAKAARAAKKLAQVQKCAPRLLAALKWCAAELDPNAPEVSVSRDDILAEAKAAIAEAEAE